MRIAIDMDNTIVDEFGSQLRPGILNFLDELRDKHQLILWTNSKKERAYEILRYHKIREFFQEIICREDYDPHDAGIRKDLRKINCDILIDDDPAEIKFNLKNKKKAFLVKSYRKNMNMKTAELDEILRKIKTL